ncbi:hypothetical protein Pelo_16794 [Pelomyxa schiedti]|nr:hypothetical protein Pelo_16794 [Pelomyxa schiedti]
MHLNIGPEFCDLVHMECILYNQEHSRPLCLLCEKMVYLLCQNFEAWFTCGSLHLLSLALIVAAASVQDGNRATGTLGWVTSRYHQRVSEVSTLSNRILCSVFSPAPVPVQLLF